MLSRPRAFARIGACKKQPWRRASAPMFEGEHRPSANKIARLVPTISAARMELFEHQTLCLPAQDRRRMTACVTQGDPFDSLPNCDQAKSIAGFRGHPSR
jgi:hypothetical protein